MFRRFWPGILPLGSRVYALECRFVPFMLELMHRLTFPTSDERYCRYRLRLDATPYKRPTYRPDKIMNFQDCSNPSLKVAGSAPIPRKLST